MCTKIVAMGNRGFVPTAGTLRSVWEVPDLSPGCRQWGAGVLSSGSCLPCVLAWAKGDFRAKTLQKKKGQGHILGEGVCLRAGGTTGRAPKEDPAGILAGRQCPVLGIPNHLKMLTV